MGGEPLLVLVKVIHCPWQKGPAGMVNDAVGGVVQLVTVMVCVAVSEVVALVTISITV